MGDLIGAAEMTSYDEFTEIRQLVKILLVPASAPAAQAGVGADARQDGRAPHRRGGLHRAGPGRVCAARTSAGRAMMLRRAVQGAGTFGTAHLVQRRADGELLVAKKVRLVGLDDARREDCLNEARVLSRVGHPYVVQARPPRPARSPFRTSAGCARRAAERRRRRRRRSTVRR